MTPFTILVVNDHGLVNGGAAKVAIDSAVGLNQAGHRVKLFCAVGPPDDVLRHAGVETICLDQHDLLDDPVRRRAAVRGLWNRPAARALAAEIAKLPCDSSIVHLHSWAKSLSPSIGPVLRASPVPVVTTLHEYFLACPNGGFFDFPQQQICERRPLSAACLIRNCDARHRAHKLWRVVRQIVLHGPGRLPGALQHIVLISDTQQRALQPYLPPRAHYYRVANPVAVDRLPRCQAETNRDYLFVGRLAPEKGALMFAQTARQLGISAVFVGDGPLRSVLENEHGCHVTGWLAADQVQQWYNRARVLVFPSLWYECQPLTVLEALARGVPVVAGDRCAALDAVQPERTGLAFAMGNRTSLAESLRRLEDREFVSRLSRQAYDDYWSDPLTLERHVASLETVYRSALRRPGD